MSILTPFNSHRPTLFVILDTETTGLKDPKACSVGMLVCRYVPPSENVAPYPQLQVIREYQEFFNPNKDIEPMASKINGLTNDLLKDCPAIETFKFPYSAYDNGITLCGHNLAYDLKVLHNNNNDELSGVLDMCNHLCTVELAKKVSSLKMAPTNFKLTTLCKEWVGLSKDELKNAHSALADCHLVLKLLNFMLAKGMIDVNDLRLT